ncbi:MAG TPA: hypothetical protein VII68_13060 [Casimicrobiaceae bacterium]|jgi:hypothetical protein
MTSRIRVVLLIAMSAVAIAGHAQRPELPKLSPAELAEANAACESLATVPNAPMSVQACKSMLGMSSTLQRMEGAASDPSARRPGDEALSCDAIFREMTSLGPAIAAGVGPGKADAALAEATALGSKQQAEMTTFMVGTFALGAAMGAASPVMPGFIATAIAGAWAASGAALGTRMAAEQNALRPKRDEAIVATTAEFEQAMLLNPRFARLADLGMQKRCEAP